MSELRCERCGDPLPETGGMGECCARCLMEKGLDSDFTSTGATWKLAPDQGQEAGTRSVPAAIGRYKILEPIGEGGMGAVYEAEQEHPRRTVALKILKPGVTSSGTLRRFELEAQALGRLQHPGIAQIYEAGTADTGFGPQPYFAMELIRGRTPLDYAKEHELSLRNRLELVAKTADAVHHAHLRGLIHRDLKPSNILVDETGQPKVLDFGVARAIDNDAQATHQTDAGQLVGTLAYMSPEQVLAEPDEIDIRCDVYALGTILYELLAGKLPLNTRGKLHEAIQAIREEDPAPLGTFDRRYRGDIETIAGKALEKDKTQRYTSAAELAADIRRFLADKPIVARPPSASYQLKKFVRRNRVLVAGVTAVFGVLILGVVVSSLQRARAERAEQAALLERDAARRAEAIARSAETAAQEERLRAKAAEQQADSDRRIAVAAEEKARLEAAEARTQRLITVWQTLVRESLRESSLRADYERASLLAVQAMRFNARMPNQPRYAVEEALHKASRIDPAPHNLLPVGNVAFRAVAFSPDGSLLAAGGVDQIVRLWNTRDPGAVPRVFHYGSRQTVTITAVAFSGDGRLLAVGSAGSDDPIRVWNLQNPGSEPLVLRFRGAAESLSLSPDGTYLAAGILDSPNPLDFSVVLWNLRNPSPRVLSTCGPASATTGPYGTVAFSRDGLRLAASCWHSVQIWNPQDPDERPLSLRPPSSSPVSTGIRAQTTFPTVRSVAFAPDNVHLAVSSVDGVQIWDLRNPERPPSPLPLGSASGSIFRTLAYEADGSHLAATNGSVWIWDVRKPGTAASAYGMSSGANAVAYSPDGRRIAVATSSGVLVWDFQRAESQPLVSALPNFVRTRNILEVQHSPDLTRLLEVDGKSLKLWNLRKPNDPATLLEGYLTDGFNGSNRYPVDWMTFSTNATRVAVSSRMRSGIGLSVWDLSGGQSRLLTSLTIPDSGFTLSKVAFSPDGFRVALTGSRVHLVDLRKPDMPQVVALALRANTVRALAFSPDGTRLALGIDARNVQVLNLRNPDTPPLSLKLLSPNTVVNLVFSPDSSRLAAANSSAEATVWDLRKPDAEALRFPTTGGHGMAFSHDGKRFATHGAAGLVRIWDLEKLTTPPLELSGLTGRAYAMMFSSDDRRLSVGTAEGAVVVWRLGSEAADYLCGRVWRNFSMEEWVSYVGEGIPYERTCPALPAGAGAPAPERK